MTELSEIEQNVGREQSRRQGKKQQRLEEEITPEGRKGSKLERDEEGHWRQLLTHMSKIKTYEVWMTTSRMETMSLEEKRTLAYEYSKKAGRCKKEGRSEDGGKAEEEESPQKAGNYKKAENSRNVGVEEEEEYSQKEGKCKQAGKCKKEGRCKTEEEDECSQKAGNYRKAGKSRNVEDKEEEECSKKAGRVKKDGTSGTEMNAWKFWEEKIEKLPTNQPTYRPKIVPTKLTKEDFMLHTEDHLLHTEDCFTNKTDSLKFEIKFGRTKPRKEEMHREEEARRKDVTPGKTGKMSEMLRAVARCTPIMMKDVARLTRSKTLSQERSPGGRGAE